MLSESYMAGGFRVVRILEDLETDSDLADLKKQIEQDHDLTRLAVVFSENSCLYTRAVTVLIECCKILDKRGGALGIVNPNSSVSFVLHTVGLEGLVRIFQSEEEIAREKVSA